MYVDEHGKEHCCEECANKKMKPLPVGLVLGATALAAVSVAAGFMIFKRPAPEPKRGEL